MSETNTVPAIWVGPEPSRSRDLGQLERGAEHVLPVSILSSPNWTVAGEDALKAATVAELDSLAAALGLWTDEFGSKLKPDKISAVDQVMAARRELLPSSNSEGNE